MTKLGEKTLFGLIIDTESMRTLAAAELPAYVIPDDELRDILQFSLRYFNDGGKIAAPTVEVLKETDMSRPGQKYSMYRVLLDNDISLDELPDETIEWAIQDLKDTYIMRRMQEWNRGATLEVVSALHGDKHAALTKIADDLVEIADGLGSFNGNGQRKLKLVRLSDEKIEQTDWLLELADGEGRIPLGELTVLAGREGGGKTTISVGIAAQLTTGTLQGDLFGTPKSVIIAAVEDSYTKTIIPRLMAAGADLTRVHRVDVVADEIIPTLNLPADIPALEKLIIKDDVGLVIIDPLSSAMADTVDTHKQSEVQNALWPIVKMAQRTGASVMGIVHVNKSKAKDIGDLIMGSRGFNTVTRATLAVIKNPDDDTIWISQGKNNNGRMDLPALTVKIEAKVVGKGRTKDITGTYIEWVGSDPRFITELLEASSAVKTESKLDLAKSWLNMYLIAQDGHAPVDEVKAEADEEGISKQTLRRAREELGIVSQHIEGSQQYEWSLS